MRRFVLAMASFLVVTGAAASDAAEAWSYADLDNTLENYVSDGGLVDYDGLARDRDALDRYVEAVERVSPDSHPDLFPTEADRLAYWMNAYNALMLQRVIDAWPVESVKKIKPLYGVFWLERHTLGGERRTLRELENKIIRQRFGDPRIHFAINCASMGCPALPRRAWRSETLDRDLDAAARRFVTSPEKVRIDRQAGAAHLSQIFEWFDEDFIDWLDRHESGHPHGVLDYVVGYLPDDQREGLDLGRLRIEWIPYDWSINAQGDRPAPR